MPRNCLQRWKCRDGIRAKPFAAEAFAFPKSASIREIRVSIWILCALLRPNSLLNFPTPKLDLFPKQGTLSGSIRGWMPETYSVCVFLRFTVCALRFTHHALRITYHTCSTLEISQLSPTWT